MFSRQVTHLPHVSTLHFHLVDLRLGDVGALLRLLQLVLHLPQLGQVSVGLLLLSDGEMTDD